LLEAQARGESDAWFDVAERLRRAAWLVGSASYCLCEWAEPDDAQADIDTQEAPGDAALDEHERARVRARRRGRRNVLLWRTPDR
jgi:hypothetical protein